MHTSVLGRTQLLERCFLESLQLIGRLIKHLHLAGSCAQPAGKMAKNSCKMHHRLRARERQQVVVGEISFVVPLFAIKEIGPAYLQSSERASKQARDCCAALAAVSLLQRQGAGKRRSRRAKMRAQRNTWSLAVGQTVAPLQARMCAIVSRAKVSRAEVWLGRSGGPVPETRPRRRARGGKVALGEPSSKFKLQTSKQETSDD